MKKKFSRLPIVAIIGKPNVGKSTLFNRIAGKRIAITSDIAGTTRDRVSTIIEWNKTTINLIDTAGLESDSGIEGLMENVDAQASLAISEADLIVFLVDGQDVISKEDQKVVARLRRAQKPLIFVVNKAEGNYAQNRISEFYQLGLGEARMISATHGTGVAELLDEITKQIQEIGDFSYTAENSKLFKIAIIGRPNVGKSSLFNKISGVERAVVSDIPGTTRDTIDSEINFNGEKFLFIDTAGIRKRGKIGKSVEKYSVLRSLKAIAEADLSIILIDATEGPVRGDVHLITNALENGKQVILAVNKVDLRAKEYVNMFKFSFMQKLPIIYISAKEGIGIIDLLKLVAERSKFANKMI